MEALVLSTPEILEKTKQYVKIVRIVSPIIGFSVFSRFTECRNNFLHSFTKAFVNSLNVKVTVI